MSEDLKFLFSNVNDWLKFNEAKNTALIALNGAAIIGLTQSVNNSIKNPVINYIIVYWLIPVFIFSLFVSLYSITGWSVKAAKWSLDKRLQANNILYYGYISALPLSKLKKKLFNKFKVNNTQVLSTFFSKSDKLLISQIHINSKIAFAKNRLFHYALCIIFFGLLSSALMVVTLRSFDKVKEWAEQYFNFNHLKEDEKKENAVISVSIKEVNCNCNNEKAKGINKKYRPIGILSPAKNQNVIFAKPFNFESKK